MILYHFTKPQFLSGIDRDGLLPHLPGAVHQGEPDPNLTAGKPVVWLTSDPNDWDYSKRRASVERITVRIEPNSARLVHFMTWARKYIPDLIEAVMADSRGGPEQVMQAEHWYVYFGTVARNRLALPRKDAA